jgi:tRNA(Ile)-lysidine synthase
MIPMLRQVVYSHLQQYEPNGSLLLALSGGPDSTSIFYLLRELSYPFEVAHYDHKWRSSSSKEKQSLQELCLQHAIPFHSETASIVPKRNCEDFARNERLTFFSRLLKERSHLKGVIFGHHADDQAETVLKRLLEGARLTNLKGLQPFSYHNDMAFHRPLLGTTKKEIVQWLEKRGITYFIDSTNLDESNLRGKMRAKILPSISQDFGKEVASNLVRLADQASELQFFIDSFIEQEKEHFEKINGEMKYTFERLNHYHSFLRPFILRAFFDACGISVSRHTIGSILSHLNCKSKNKIICLGKGILKVHFPALFFTHKRIDEESKDEYALATQNNASCNI